MISPDWTISVTCCATVCACFALTSASCTFGDWEAMAEIVPSFTCSQCAWKTSASRKGLFWRHAAASCAASGSSFKKSSNCMSMSASLALRWTASSSVMAGDGSDIFAASASAAGMGAPSTVGATGAAV